MLGLYWATQSRAPTSSGRLARDWVTELYWVLRLTRASLVFIAREAGE